VQTGEALLGQNVYIRISALVYIRRARLEDATVAPSRPLSYGAAFDALTCVRGALPFLHGVAR
jgi:hypothetical protein